MLILWDGNSVQFSSVGIIFTSKSRCSLHFSLLSLNLFTYNVRYWCVCLCCIHTVQWAYMWMCSTSFETYKAHHIMSAQTLKCLNKTYYVFADNWNRKNTTHEHTNTHHTSERLRERTQWNMASKTFRRKCRNGKCASIKLHFCCVF